MKQLLWANLALLIFLSLAPLPAARRATPPPGQENGYVTRTYTDAKGRSMTYYLHIPGNANQSQQYYPLVLLLHGGGERGHSVDSPEQNRSVLVGDPYVKQWTSAQVQDHWPSFIVVPQLIDNQQWVNVPSSQGSYRLAPQPTNALLLAKETVDALLQTYPNIDAGRLYITGISIGGYGVWDAIERWPDGFAAAAPVSGGGDPSEAIKLTHLPIWAFQGGNDGDPPPSASRAMIDAIRAFGGHPLYTEFKQSGHDIWLQVYTSSAFLSWLFAQKSLPPNLFWGIHNEALFYHLYILLQRYLPPFLLFCMLGSLLFLVYDSRKQHKR
jgi:predicted peptidase